MILRDDTMVEPLVFWEINLHFFCVLNSGEYILSCPYHDSCHGSILF
jgi:hypothetical protein